jgi:Domain of unknown function (DUF4190)/GYF domain 2
MNYRIVGQDGKTYGPVAEEKIREWLAQGRIESRSPIFVEGAGDWTFVGLLPEFSPQASPPTMGSLRPDLTLAHKTNGFATAGFICGLLSLLGFCCCGCLPVSLLGIIFSTIAIVQIRSNTPPQNGMGFAIAGLVCSITGLVVGLVIGLVNGLVGTLADPNVAQWPAHWR